MSGYNRFEQAVGGALDRFPRVKNTIEAAYQRVNYHLLADSDFTYEVHDDASLMPTEASFNVAGAAGRFVGFYDVQPWSPAMDEYFVHEVNGATASITVFGDGSATHVADTAAWNYQQGSRTHWHPTEEERLVFNDLADGTAVAHDVDLTSGERITHARPIQAVDPTGGGFLSIDYRRLDCNDPAYGYGEAGAVPSDDGIYHLDFDGGEERLIPMEMLVEESDAGVPQERHYLHHARYAPDGSRFTFLHRWRQDSHRRTRLVMADTTGEFRELVSHPQLSHFCWLDTQRLFLWGATEDHGRGYVVVDVDDESVMPVDALAGFGDGHPSVSPDGEWIVIDTYPDRRRRRSLTLYHLESERVIPVGEFHAPFRFDGANRCDLHPRWSPDGHRISIDSTHDGVRRSYVLDVSELVAEDQPIS